MKRIIGFALVMCVLWARSADAQLHARGDCRGAADQQPELILITEGRRSAQ